MASSHNLKLSLPSQDPATLEWARVTMPGKAEGHLEGWKYLIFDDEHNSVRSAGADVSWDLDKPVVAEDYSANYVGLLTPGYGIYAYKDRNDLVKAVDILLLAQAEKQFGSFSSIGFMVLVKVALWGEVLEHDNGYLSQFAYPLAFYTVGLPHICTEIQKVFINMSCYNVRVRENFSTIRDKELKTEDGKVGMSFCLDSSVFEWPNENDS